METLRSAIEYIKALDNIVRKQSEKDMKLPTSIAETNRNASENSHYSENSFNLAPQYNTANDLYQYTHFGDQVIAKNAELYSYPWDCRFTFV